jgi:conjugal transfer pilus assembly protein TraU
MKKSFIFIVTFFVSFNLYADDTCHGEWVDPINDVCWSCLFPITIGSMTVVSGEEPDTDNPSSPVCACGTPVPRIGITTGFWEPIAMTDVTRTPFCMVNMGGLQLDMGDSFAQGTQETANSDQNNSFYYVHWYTYPLIFWLDIITNVLCVETGDFDIAYLTELDPTWTDDELAFLLNPEAMMFENPIAQASCASDSIAASVGLPIDSLFWCAGSQGGMYPLDGNVQEHVGGVQASTLLTERMAYKLHRPPTFLLDSVPENSPTLCYEYPNPIIPKSRYRYQMVNPLPTTGSGGCHPFGETTSVWGSGHEYPVDGEDFGYVLFRKRNCCML